jgi:hypothetical protein
LIIRFVLFFAQLPPTASVIFPDDNRKNHKHFVNPFENNIFVPVNDEGSTGLLLFCLFARSYDGEKRDKSDG